MTIGYFWLFSAMLLSGAWFILLRMAAEGASAVMAQTVHVGGTLVGVAIFFLPIVLAAKIRGEGAPALGPHWRLAVVAGIVICAANYFMFKAYGAKVPLSIVSVVLNLSCVMPVLFGFLFLHERLHATQLLGLILAVIAAILISH